MTTIPTNMIIPDEMPRINLTDNARHILEQRYLLPGETPEQRFWAVAMRMGSVEGPPEGAARRAIEFYVHLLAPLRFLPNSPAIANVYSRKGCMSACFTLSPDDTIESIYQVSRDAAAVISSGGGMGYGLSDIREENAPVNNVQKVACGPIAVLKKYSEDSHMVSQAFRKGANMAQLAVDHPDIRKFIHCKDDGTSLTNFNISVQVTDAFMEKVLEAQCNTDPAAPWDLISRYDGHVTETVDALELWNEIVESAHKTGDPGVVFIDRVQATHPNPQYGPIKTSNPCGEEFLESYNSCCLGSINLAAHVTEDGQVDWDLLEKTVKLSTRFLDYLIDANIYPTTDGTNSKYEEMATSTRRIGLGVMGWADMLAKLGLHYTSTRALTLASGLSRFITGKAWESSNAMATNRGAYPQFYESVRYGSHHKANFPVRNSSVTTIAPTGTISRIAGCSSGIEPYYSLVTKSKVLWDGVSAQAELIDVVAPLRAAVEEDASVAEELVRNPNACLIGLGLDPESFQTANEIPYDKHVDMLAAWQEHVTNSVSKTVNLPNHAEPNDVQNVMERAYNSSCKAITVYRDGCRDVQVLNAMETKTETKQVKEVGKKQRPERLVGSTIRKPTGHGTMYVIINGDEGGRPVECFVNLGKGGHCSNAFTEALGRLVTLSLQSGATVEAVYDQLRDISCGHVSWNSDGSVVKSVPDGIAHVLASYIGDNVLQVYKDHDVSDKMCFCGGRMIQYDGCVTCEACGNQECG